MNTVIKAAVKLTHRNACCSQILALRGCTTSSSSSIEKGDVPGLSKKIVDVPDEGVGCPCASKEGVYKNPEYFSYHIGSYYEAEVEMMKYRLPQPSNKSKK